MTCGNMCTKYTIRTCISYEDLPVFGYLALLSLRKKRFWQVKGSALGPSVESCVVCCDNEASRRVYAGFCSVSLSTFVRRAMAAYIPMCARSTTVQQCWTRVFEVTKSNQTHASNYPL